MPQKRQGCIQYTDTIMVDHIRLLQFKDKQSKIKPQTYTNEDVLFCDEAIHSEHLFWREIDGTPMYQLCNYLKDFPKSETLISVQWQSN